MKVLVSTPIDRKLSGSVQVPGDKSVSHRAAMLASFAQGTSSITGWLQAEDTLATLAACEALGAKVEWQQRESEQARLIITGCNGQFQPVERLDFGNSGTGVRLMMGLLAGQGLKATLTGDESLRSRPMGRIIHPLRRMGARFFSFTSDDKITLPVTIQPAEQLKAMDFTMPVASAQLQAAVLLAGMQADGVTRIHQPVQFRDHSERMLLQFGANLRRVSANTLEIERSQLQASDVQVPADFSSAAFLIAAATLVRGSEIALPNIGVNPTRTGLLDLLSSMSGRFSVADQTTAQEPVATLNVTHAALQGIDVPQELVANSIDEFPILMALATCAEGMTRVRGAAELRVKESDRIAVMCKALKQLGVSLQEYPDGVDVQGLGGQLPSGGEVSAHGDHRIAMSLAVLGLVAKQPIVIHGAKAIATSYPQFVDQMNHLGGDLEWRNV